MTRSAQSVLEGNRDAGIGSLVAYYPAGYPTLKDSIEAVIAIGNAGADVIELGVPYSDPVMDGPVIQAATEEALANGFKLRQLFDAIREIKAKIDTPVLVMSYWNPIIQFGLERFATELKAAGGAGIITPDLIPDEGSNWIQLADDLVLEHVFLATPSSSDARVKSACDSSRGFVYAVSTMGITGERAEVDANARKVVRAIRDADATQIAAVGIGISTSEQVRDVNSYADAAIVGSAIVKAYQQSGVVGLTELVTDLVQGAKSSHKENH